MPSEPTIDQGPLERRRIRHNAAESPNRLLRTVQVMTGFTRSRSAQLGLSATSTAPNIAVAFTLSSGVSSGRETPGSWAPAKPQGAPFAHPLNVLSADHSHQQSVVHDQQ